MITDVRGNRLTRKGFGCMLVGSIAGSYLVIGAITGEYNPARQLDALNEQSREGAEKSALVEKIDTDGDFSISQNELEAFERRTGLDLGIKLSAPAEDLYGLPVEDVQNANRVYERSK